MKKYFVVMVDFLQVAFFYFLLIFADKKCGQIDICGHINIYGQINICGQINVCGQQIFADKKNLRIN